MFVKNGESILRFGVIYGHSTYLSFLFLFLQACLCVVLQYEGWGLF